MVPENIDTSPRKGLEIPVGFMGGGGGGVKGPENSETSEILPSEIWICCLTLKNSFIYNNFFYYVINHMLFS